MSSGDPLGRTGARVSVHPSVEVFGAERVTIGSDVRIDCFAVITAGEPGVEIGDYVHIGVGACLLGGAGITIGDFVSISPRATILSTSDDFVGGHMTGPLVPERFRRVDAAPVTVGRHAVVGSGAVLMPGVTLGFGAAVGALSLVKEDVGEGEVVAGTPARPVGRRDVGRLRELQAEFDSARTPE